MIGFRVSILHLMKDRSRRYCGLHTLQMVWVGTSFGIGLCAMVLSKITQKSIALKGYLLVAAMDSGWDLVASLHTTKLK